MIIIFLYNKKKNLGQWEYKKNYIISIMFAMTTSFLWMSSCQFYSGLMKRNALNKTTQKG